MLDSGGNSNTQKYKSPVRKLVRFFETSRNQWKTKCQEAKYHCKLLKNQIRHLTKVKEETKIRVKELENELSFIKAKEKEMNQEITELKKNLK